MNALPREEQIGWPRKSAKITDGSATQGAELSEFAGLS
jgi:hypothetical protein